MNHFLAINVVVHNQGDTRLMGHKFKCYEFLYCVAKHVLKTWTNFKTLGQHVPKHLHSTKKSVCLLHHFPSYMLFLLTWVPCSFATKHIYLILTARNPKLSAVLERKIACTAINFVITKPPTIFLKRTLQIISNN